MARIENVEKWGESYLSGIWDSVEQPGVADDAVQVFQDTRDLCERPIEIIMLAGLIGTSFGYSSAPNVVTPADYLNHLKFDDCDAHVIVPQMLIPQFNYRADFYVDLFTNGHRRVSLFVECDGHDFHEKTKEQAARDRKRDRDLQSLGINVLRFTGSELHRDPEGCFAEIDLFGCAIIEKCWVDAGRDVFGYRSSQARKALPETPHARS